MTEKTRPIRVIRHAQIPLSDGIVLSAQIWLPADAEQDPVPAILEYLPYRKRDGTADRDALNHPYVAERGYAFYALDLRKCGRSRRPGQTAHYVGDLALYGSELGAAPNNDLCQNAQAVTAGSTSASSVRPAISSESPR